MSLNNQFKFKCLLFDNRCAHFMERVEILQKKRAVLGVHILYHNPYPIRFCNQPIIGYT